MTIHTKFNKGDRVFILHNNKVLNPSVANINWNLKSGLKYYLASSYINEDSGFDESQLFSTKEELLNSL